MKHTPGPWTKHLVGCHFEVWDKDAVVVASIPIYYASQNESGANVRLITAAPELLAALQKMIDVAQNHRSAEQEDDALESALIAINKAEYL